MRSRAATLTASPGAAPLARRTALTATAAVIAGLALTAPAQSAVPNGRLIEVFHGINFIGIDGYPDAPQLVEVVRGGNVVGSVVVTPVGGLAEINHTGAGDCFDGPTPDILPGDVVRVRPQDAPVGDADTSEVKDVFHGGAQVVTTVADDPVTTDVDETVKVIRVEGHARQPGTTGPLDNAEIRLNHPGGTWGAAGANGRKDWRVAATINPDGSYRADFEGATAADLSAASGAEVAAEWGNANLTEITVYDGAGSACPPGDRTAVTQVSPRFVNASGSPVKISGVAEAAVGNVGVRVDAPGAPTHDVSPAGGTWSVDVPAAEFGTEDGPVDIVVEYDAVRGPETARVTVDRTVPAPPTGSRRSGTFTDPFLFALAAEPNADIRYGLGAAVPNLAFTGALSIASDTTIGATARDAAGNVSARATFTFTRGTATTPVDKPTPTPVVVPTTIIRIVPGVGAAPPQRAVRGIVARSLRVSGLAVSRRISTRRLLSRGLAVSMRVKDGTRVVRLAVYRARDGRRSGRALYVTHRSPSSAGRFRTTLRDRGLARTLRAGQYVVEARPGTSRSALGRRSRIAFRVTR